MGSYFNEFIQIMVWGERELSHSLSFLALRQASNEKYILRIQIYLYVWIHSILSFMAFSHVNYFKTSSKFGSKKILILMGWSLKELYSTLKYNKDKTWCREHENIIEDEIQIILGCEEMCCRQPTEKGFWT